MGRLRSPMSPLSLWSHVGECKTAFGNNHHNHHRMQHRLLMGSDTESLQEVWLLKRQAPSGHRGDHAGVPAAPHPPCRKPILVLSINPRGVHPLSHGRPSVAAKCRTKTSHWLDEVDGGRIGGSAAANPTRTHR